MMTEQLSDLIADALDEAFTLGGQDSAAHERGDRVTRREVSKEFAEVKGRVRTALSALRQGAEPDEPMAEHWGVDVRVDGERILTIESECLSGIENIKDYAGTVRGAARHLLAFIGGSAPALPAEPARPELLEEIAELDKLYQAATPGEWRNRDTRGWAHPAVYVERTDGLTIARIADLTCTVGKWERETANAEWIAALHNAWPRIRRALKGETK